MVAMMMVVVVVVMYLRDATHCFEKIQTFEWLFFVFSFIFVYLFFTYRQAAHQCLEFLI